MGLRAISHRFRTRLDPREPARRPVAAGPTACPQGTQTPVAGKPSPGHFRVVLRSLSPAGRRGNEAHVFWPQSGCSARLPGTRVRPRRHEKSSAAILGRWGLSEAQPRDEPPSSPTGAHSSCGDVCRPSAGAPRSRLRHDTSIHAPRRNRPGGPCGAGIPGLEHCAKKRSGRCISRGTARVREYAHLRARVTTARRVSSSRRSICSSFQGAEDDLQRSVAKSGWLVKYRELYLKYPISY